MEDLRHEIELVLARVAGLEAERARTLAQREARIVELEAQVVELTVELQRRKKGFRPKANALSRPKGDKDGRAKGERKHPGVVRPPSNPVPRTSFTTCGTRSVSIAVGRSKTRASLTNTRSKTSGRRVWTSIVIDGTGSVAHAVRRCLNRPPARGHRRLRRAAHEALDGLLPGASGDLAGQVHHALGRGVRAEAESRRSTFSGPATSSIRWSSGCLSCSSRNP